MTARSLPPLFDPCSYQNSSLLLNTLEDFLPPALEPLSTTDYTRGLPIPMPFAHHLVYFPPPLPLSSLQQDGTDPLHSPGSPFTHRMWAGGLIDYSDYKLSLNGAPAFCLERITDLSVEGQEGQEKVLVRIERRFSHFKYRDHNSDQDEISRGMKESLSGYSGEAEGRGALEIRNLIFLRDGSLKQTPDKMHSPPRIIKLSGAPDFSHTLIPSAALLFRFSALTFNAHAIHLDKHYCQEVEGHRNLLVHGPLSVILMVEVLRRHLENLHRRSGTPPNVEEMIEHMEYRNLAPLYAEEEMRVCGRKRMNGEYQMWIEGKEGGLAVRGVMKTNVKTLLHR